MVAASCGGLGCKLVHPPYVRATDDSDAATPTYDVGDGGHTLDATTDVDAHSPQTSASGSDATLTSEGANDASANGTTTADASSATTADASSHASTLLDAGPGAPTSASPALDDASATGTSGASSSVLSGDSQTAATDSPLSDAPDASAGCTRLTNPVFLDFANVSPTTSSGGDTNWEFDIEGGVKGTLYVASQHLTSEITAGSPATLHMSGLVSEYAQFGVHFTPCVDASSFRGVTVELAGAAGPNGRVRVEVQTTSTTIHDNNPQGTCVPQNPDLWWYECAHPDFPLTLPTPETPVDSPWSAFYGGIPTDVPDPATITGLEIEFDWDPGLAATFDADLTVSKIAFWP